MNTAIPPHLRPAYERENAFSLGCRVAHAARVTHPHDVHSLVSGLSGTIYRCTPDHAEDYDSVTRYEDGTFAIELRAGPCVSPARVPVDGPFTETVRIAYALANLLFHLDHLPNADHSNHKDVRKPLERRHYVDGPTSEPVPLTPFIGSTTAFAAGLLMPGDNPGSPFREAAENTRKEASYDIKALAHTLDLPYDLVLYRARMSTFMDVERATPRRTSLLELVYTYREAAQNSRFIEARKIARQIRDDADHQITELNALIED